MIFFLKRKDKVSSIFEEITWEWSCHCFIQMHLSCISSVWDRARYDPGWVNQHSAKILQDTTQKSVIMLPLGAHG